MEVSYIAGGVHHGEVVDDVAEHLEDLRHHDVLALQ